MDAGERLVLNYAKAVQQRRALEAIEARRCEETGEKPKVVHVLPDVMTVHEMAEWRAKDGNCGCTQCTQRAVSWGLIEEKPKRGSKPFDVFAGIR